MKYFILLPKLKHTYQSSTKFSNNLKESKVFNTNENLNRKCN